MKLLIFITTCALVFVSCQKDNKSLMLKDASSDDSLTTITYGTVCGWCSGIDSLTITSDNLCYVSKRPCDSPAKVENKTISEQEKEDLLSSLDLNDFSQIQLNTCYVCVDGCDTWISVKTNNYYHKIRYGYEDSTAIQSIKNFLDNLNILRAKFE
jgi:hypothetical protein